MIWLLVISQKGGYRLHSVHKDKATAEAWKACKAHDGDDCELVEVAANDVDILREELERLETK